MVSQKNSIYLTTKEKGTRKNLINFILMIATLIMMSACRDNPPTQTPLDSSSAIATIVAATLSAIPSATPVPTSTVTPFPASPLEEWKIYNSEYGFSISYPADFVITPNEDNTSVYLGEQIHISIGNFNPLDCRGDCPVVESTNPAIVAGLEAIKATGYLGAIGGNIPQQYMRYILQRDNLYYSFTLYALGFHAQVNDPSTIWPLKDDDIALFKQILTTFKFTN